MMHNPDMEFIKEITNGDTPPVRGYNTAEEERGMEAGPLGLD